MSLIKITGSVQGVEGTLPRLSGSRAAVWARLLQSMEGGGQLLEGEIRERLQGAAQERTGLLARSVYHDVRTRGKDTVLLLAGVRRQAFYGQFIEKGLPAHVRHVRSRDVRSVILKTGRLSRKRVALGVAFVKDQPARPFIHPAFEDVRVRIVADILGAVRKGARDARA